MAIERHLDEERQARLELLIDRYKDAQHRRLVKRGVALWNRAEADVLRARYMTDPPAGKIN